MPTYVYHYSTTRQPQPGMEEKQDGIVTRERPLTSWEEYRDLKRVIADHGNPPREPEGMTIVSLTLLHTVGE